eukprot:GHRQ01019736.1.p4 GENE.GHRQ01019736.1~~GHRQ01019736.1.p4  ORF type:complete len:108 (-),score=39.50 GHRQ01019736.1:1026-1349(-)
MGFSMATPLEMYHGARHARPKESPYLVRGQGACKSTTRPPHVQSTVRVQYTAAAELDTNDSKQQLNLQASRAWYPTARHLRAGLQQGHGSSRSSSSSSSSRCSHAAC